MKDWAPTKSSPVGLGNYSHVGIVLMSRVLQNRSKVAIDIDLESVVAQNSEGEGCAGRGKWRLYLDSA
jgi:hypothetical protein